MFGSPVLETAISLAFVYLLFSLLVSAVNELVLGNLAHLRARVLEESLEALLSNLDPGRSPLQRQWEVVKEIGRAIRELGAPPPPPARAPGKLADELFEHPLIKGLAPWGNRCPGYLAPATFADAVISLVLKKSQPPLASASGTFAHLRDSLAQLPDQAARQILGSLWLGANDLGEARKRLESWFNDSMERVSGVYRRYTQVWLIFWSALVVLLLNVDTLELTKRLVADSAFRESLVSAAAQQVENPADPAKAPSVEQLQADIVRLQLPIGWRWSTNPLPVEKVVSSNANGLMLTNYVTNAPAYLASWTLARPPLPASAGGWFLKLVGLVISIAAISQGAPFWFDLLNKLTNLRAAGKPPAKTAN